MPDATDVTAVDQASGRLDSFLARLARLALEDLRLISLPLPDPDGRAQLMADIERIADEAGRLALVAQARKKAHDAIAQAYARHQLDPTWAGLNWGRSLGTTEDRIGLTLAVEDAAVGSVMRDLLDEDQVAALTEPFEHAAGMSGSTTTSLSLRRPDRVGWLVWIVFVVIVIGGVASYYGLGAGLLIPAILLAIAVGAWGRRAA